MPHTATLRLIAPGNARPGDVVWFRYNGVGEPRPVRVCNRGPLGQCYVMFVDDAGRDIPGGWLAVNDGKELWS